MTDPVVTLPDLERRQSKLLAWILLFTLLFSVIVLFTMTVFNPHNDPDRPRYAGLILGLIGFLLAASFLNRGGHYKVSAILLVACAALVPWLSVLIDPSITQGDFIPLLYFTFSVLLASMLLPTAFTMILAVFQFTGLSLVIFLSPASATINWFSFISYVFLTSVFSILANSIIQSDLQQIETQKRQLATDEAIMREQAIRDDLTFLFNRRYMVETLKRETQRAIRKQVPMGIIMLDVDHFKQVNDTLGHAAGDAVLQKLGAYIFEQVRHSDIVCRYGGDEFVLVLPEASLTTAVERAEKLREGLKNIDITELVGTFHPAFITLSLGVAVYPENGTDDEMLLKSADDALYRAKHAGGNCVRVANDVAYQPQSD